MREGAQRIRNQLSLTQRPLCALSVSAAVNLYNLSLIFKLTHYLLESFIERVTSFDVYSAAFSIQKQM